MIQETKLLGCLAQFALAGTTQVTPSPTGGPIVSSGFIPDNSAVDGTSAALWMPLGIIAEAKEKVSSSKIEIYKPSPGTLSLSDVRESKFKRTLGLKITDCSNLMWLALRRALVVASPRTGTLGQHVPLTGGTIRGWLKIQSYNQDTNSQELAEQFWCTMSIDNDVTYGGDKNVEFDGTFTQLWSALNSATGA
jgi:hypothetical protein